MFIFLFFVLFLTYNKNDNMMNYESSSLYTYIQVDRVQNRVAVDKFLGRTFLEERSPTLSFDKNQWVCLECVVEEVICLLITWLQSCCSLHMNLIHKKRQMMPQCCHYTSGNQLAQTANTDILTLSFQPQQLSQSSQPVFQAQTLSNLYVVDSLMRN